LANFYCVNSVEEADDLKPCQCEYQRDGSDSYL
jgi:hypothetical protein